LEKLLFLWEDMSQRKIYITGGIGSRYSGEAFGLPYELPNLRAYAESCAAIASMMWNYRMFLVTGEGRFMDLFEDTLYNGFLSSVSLNGREYFYVNPLASRGEHRRRPWYDTTCCPPNIQRMLACLPGYFYGVNKEGIWINLYGESESVIPLPLGNKVRIVQNTQYPWKGKVRLLVSSETEERISLFLRIPKWSKDCRVTADGQEFSPEPGKYLQLKYLVRRKERAIDLHFKIQPTLYRAHPEIESTRSCVAIKRGPVVYCLESVDNPRINLFNCWLANPRLKEKFDSNFMSGTYVVSGDMLSGKSKDLSLYERIDECPKAKFEKRKFKAIPYYLWANRGPSKMVVWVGRNLGKKS
ncbi:MAG: glycoside hydrolase family 127 protein, partial [Candidatus Omnitrophica bacterium]|nr:glycoside hydrolase family 127 protein [Candidatus Omnitrophota bacterium]